VGKVKWPRPADPSRIDLSNPRDLRYWMHEFGCASGELGAAVREIGENAGRIRKYFRDRKSRGRRTENESSRTAKGVQRISIGRDA
jgi:hypothetical protein